MIVVIDHLDSFTFNIVHLLRQLGREVVVYDYREVDEKVCVKAAGVILGPGPHCPSDVAESIDLMLCLAGRVPVLGICLGHQIIGTALGGRIRRATRVVHGICSEIHHKGRGLFVGMKDPVGFVRYHSQVVTDPIPSVLRLDARDEDGDVAAFSHIAKPIWGVQFHPESILSLDGHVLLQNFVDRVAAFGEVRIAHQRHGKSSVSVGSGEGNPS